MWEEPREADTRICAFLFFADFPNRLCQYCKQSQNPTCLIACCYVCLSCVPRGRDGLLNDVIQCYAAAAQHKLVQFGTKLRNVFFNLFSWWTETACLELRPFSMLRLIDECMWSIGGAIPEGTRSVWQETCPCVASITDVGDYPAITAYEAFRFAAKLSYFPVGLTHFTIILVL